MGDYPSKAHTGAIHTHVRPYYMHTSNSPRTLLRAHKPSGEGVLNFWGVRTTKEYHYPESQIPES